MRQHYVAHGPASLQSGANLDAPNAVHGVHGAELGRKRLSARKQAPAGRWRCRAHRRRRGRSRYGLRKPARVRVVDRVRHARLNARLDLMTDLQATLLQCSAREAMLLRPENDAEIVSIHLLDMHDGHAGNTASHC